MYRSKSSAPRKTAPLNISAPMMVRRELTPQIQGILNAYYFKIDQELSGGLPEDVRKKFTEAQGQIIEPRSAVFVHRYSEKSSIRDNADSTAFTRIRRLRCCFSSPDLREASPVRHCALRSFARSKSPEPPLRSKTPYPDVHDPTAAGFFSSGENVRRKRPVIRRVLDMGGCTKAEKLDISDFDRVRIPRAGAQNGKHPSRGRQQFRA